MLRLRAEGRARSLGVSNFNPRHLQRLIEVTGIVPAVNQIELHPCFQQKAVQALCSRYVLRQVKPIQRPNATTPTHSAIEAPPAILAAAGGFAAVSQLATPRYVVE